MALTYRTLFRNCQYFCIITKPVKSGVVRNQPLRSLSNISFCRNNIFSKPLFDIKQISCISISSRSYVAQNGSSQNPQEPEEKKTGLIQRFKQMYRDYWYVLVPVHMATSAVWFGGFYYAVRSGVDVLSLLEYLGVNETLMAPLRDSSAGYFALAFALYKLATPLRYAVTVGGTTFAIKKLTAIGWIRPVPTRERIKEMFQERKDNLQDRFNESKQHYQTQMKEKRNHVMDEMRRYKTEIRNMKNKWRRC
ncbi:uncharacterized protein C18orf19 homolog A isoform X2 [Ostrinia furnacalis]|uniref:uncharacterized protein C18orf19 homolog A isoform X2 n=1 Tax=Ostrinia furnacalis TaxID=93504 RepID=UPI00103A2859|nr:uncharacterized protein C18orf19 homolog A isoform X2 [Ostrinia furnacalis]